MARSRPAVDTARRMKMANLIRQKRLEAGLDQIGLAKRLGVTPAAVGNWERCIARPDFDTIPGLCGALGGCGVSGLSPGGFQFLGSETVGQDLLDACALLLIREDRYLG